MHHRLLGFSTSGYYIEPTWYTIHGIFRITPKKPALDYGSIKKAKIIIVVLIENTMDARGEYPLSTEILPSFNIIRQWVNWDLASWF